MLCHTQRSFTGGALRLLAATAVAAVLTIGCSSDDAETDGDTIESTPTTIPGAADNVDDGSEDGLELEGEGNVPGSDADDETDSDEETVDG